MRLGRRGLWLIVLGVVSYLVFLIATLPAAHAWSWFGRKVPAQAFGLTGTVWSGNAAVVQAGPGRLDAVQWRVKPTALFLGRLGVDARTRLPGDGRAEGDLQLAPGRLHGRDVKLNMPMADLLRWTGARLAVGVDGRVDALLRQVTMNQGRLTSADGVINWHQGVIRLGSRAIPLGEVALRLEPADDGTIGRLANQGGALRIAGTLRLNPDGTFTFDGNANATGQGDDEVRQALALLGMPADGSPLQIKLAGSLDQGGVRLQPLTR